PCSDSGEDQGIGLVVVLDVDVRVPLDHRGQHRVLVPHALPEGVLDPLSRGHPDHLTTALDGPGRHAPPQARPVVSSGPLGSIGRRLNERQIGRRCGQAGVEDPAHDELLAVVALPERVTQTPLGLDGIEVDVNPTVITDDDPGYTRTSERRVDAENAEHGASKGEWEAPCSAQVSRSVSLCWTRSIEESARS